MSEVNSTPPEIMETATNSSPLVEAANKVAEGWGVKKFAMEMVTRLKDSNMSRYLAVAPAMAMENVIGTGEHQIPADINSLLRNIDVTDLPTALLTVGGFVLGTEVGSLVAGKPGAGFGSIVGAGLGAVAGTAWRMYF
jgi:hypothetical protein